MTHGFKGKVSLFIGYNFWTKKSKYVAVISLPTYWTWMYCNILYLVLWHSIPSMILLLKEKDLKWVHCKKRQFHTYSTYSTCSLKKKTFCITHNATRLQIIFFASESTQHNSSHKKTYVPPVVLLLHKTCKHTLTRNIKRELHFK